MVNITLEKMLNLLVDCILNAKEIPTFYYKREWETGYPEYIEIRDVDLLDTRFRTWDDDFSEYEWELKESNIYVEEE